MTYADTKAFNEYCRIKMLSAFNVKGAVNKIRINQHAVKYTFGDGSHMKICHTTSVAHVFKAGHLKGVQWFRMNLPLNINSRGLK